MPLLIISDPSTGKSQKIELEDAKMSSLIGKRIGEVVDGAAAGMQGYKLKITGGTDKDGIPMRPDIHGGAKSSVILSKGIGFKPKNDGERKRKVIRGNIVNAETKFLNLSIVGQPKGRKKAEKKEKEADLAEIKSE